VTYRKLLIQCHAIVYVQKLLALAEGMVAWGLLAGTGYVGSRRRPFDQFVELSDFS
jgi:hypothetical protein